MFSRITPLLRSHTLLKPFHKNGKQVRTLFVLKTPDYALDDGIAPFMSPDNLKRHFHEFNMHYVTLANQLTMEVPPFDTMGAIDILKRTRLDAADSLLTDAIGNVLNHELFWQSVRPSGTQMPTAVRKLIQHNFNSVKEFKQRFSTVANAVPSNGWVFLVLREGKLEILRSKDGGTLFGQNAVYPLLALDLYEHSYLFDYGSDRKTYINRYFDAIDWEGVEKKLNAIPADVW